MLQASRFDTIPAPIALSVLGYSAQQAQTAYSSDSTFLFDGQLA